MVTELSQREREVLDGLRHIAAEQLSGAAELGPDDDLAATLELDSLTRATLVVAVEDRLRVMPDDDALERVRTAADLCRLVARAETETFAR